jgi:hypothetical protein
VVAAGEADVRLFGRDLHVTNARVVPAGAHAEGLPLIARLGGRRVGVLIADVA